MIAIGNIRQVVLCIGLVSSLLAYGCSSDDPFAPSVVSGPTYTASTIAALAGTLMVDTDTATTISVTATNTADSSDTFTISSSTAATSHSLLLAGFKGSTTGETYDLSVTLTPLIGNATTVSGGQVTTAALPSGFPPLVVGTPDVGAPAPEPGFLFMDVRQWDQGAALTNWWIVAVDTAGDVRWYMPTSNSAGTADDADEIRFLSNGNLLFVQPDTTLIEVDLLGNIVHEWVSNMDTNFGNPAANRIDVDVDTFHHDVLELPNGNFLALSTRRRFVAGYPSSDTDSAAVAADAYIIEDTVVEFVPETGAVVTEWSLMSATDPEGYGTTPLNPPLDPLRIGYDSLGNFWAGKYPDVDATYRCTANVVPNNGCYDWSHANGIAYNPYLNLILVSVRHQDAVVAFSRGTNAVEYILGNGDNWNTTLQAKLLTLTAGTNIEWQYHQHAPMFTSTGNVLLFDNGNYRASPFATKVAAPSNYSRTVEYNVDLVADGYGGFSSRTATQVWEYRRTDRYTPFISDADEQPTTGHVIAHFGGVVRDAASACAASDGIFPGDKFVNIVEVTKDATPLRTFDLTIGDTDCSSTEGWISYRSMKVPSLIR